MKQLKDSVRNVLAKTVRSGLAVAVLAILGAGSVYAQSFSTDARLVGMGGLGGQKTDALGLAGKERDYTEIPLPLGLFQTLRRKDVFNPKEKGTFNILKALDFVSNPTQIVVNRDGSGAAAALASDVLRADVKRDLNRYRGFAPEDVHTGGVLAPKWGKTFKVREKGDEYHGVFFGVGPYVTLKTDVDISDNLETLFANPSTPVPANETFFIGRDRTDASNVCNGAIKLVDCASTFAVQSAVGATTGYRARFAVPAQLTKSLAKGETSDRDGIYVAFSISYLRGIRYEDVDLTLRIETDSSALVDTFPAAKPLTVDRIWSGHGAGRTADFSMAAVLDRLSFNFGAEGIGNRMVWKDIRSRRYEIASLTNNNAFTKTAITLDSTNKEVKLPVRYSAGGTYKFDNITAGAQFRHGLQRTEFDAGAEYPWWFMEFRGGMRYTDPKWNPSVGLGLKMGDKWAFDIAAYGSSSNIEHASRMAVVTSFRINH